MFCSKMIYLTLSKSDERFTLCTVFVSGGPDGKESACSVGDLGLIPGLGRSPGGWHGNPLQYSWPGESPWTEEPGRL